MKLDQRWRVNAPQVVGEVLEGEAIIINLESGAYYSLDQVGGDVWQVIESHASGEEIVQLVMGRYVIEYEEAVRQMLALLQTLHNENLIAPVTDGPVDTTHADQPALDEKLPFVSPVLEKYTDMEDLILLDPIHDVTEMGWPNVKQD